MRRRSLLSVLALGACSGCVEHPLPTLRGVVARKRIVGPSGSLLTISADKISVESARLAKKLPRDGERANTTITNAQESTLPEVEYQVAVRHDNRSYIDGVASGETEVYRTNREAFNQMMAADRLKFQVGLVNRPALLTPSQVVRTGTVEEKRVVGTVAREGKKPTKRTVLSVSEDGIDANGNVLDAERTVGARNEQKLRERFRSVEYLLTAHHRGRRRHYATKRTQFNRARVGKRMQFEAGGEMGEKLVRFVSREEIR